MEVIDKNLNIENYSLKPDFKIIFTDNENRKEYNVHSFLLNINYFDVIKSNEFMEKSEAILYIENMDIINDFLKFIYTGTMDLDLYENKNKNNINENKNNNLQYKSINKDRKDKIESLKKLSNYLMMEELENLCDYFLM